LQLSYSAPEPETASYNSSTNTKLMSSPHTISIDNRLVGPSADLLLIAEVGQAHDGSLGMAHAYIDAIAQTGAHAVKFQTHIAEAESTPQERFRVPVFPQDKTRYEYWNRTGFEKSQWLELADHARHKGLLFMSSAFSQLAVEWLVECGVAAWKVASGEVSSWPMLRQMSQTGRPILLSSGMSSWSELDQTVAFLKKCNAPFGMFQCTTNYPCPPNKWGLNIIGQMQARYACPVGLSDHSGTITPSIAAVAQGASMLEFHVAFSKQQFGPDTSASLTLDQVQQLVEGVNQLRIALASPLDKDEMASGLQETYKLFSKSIVAARDLKAGQVVGLDDLAYKKPGTGIPAREFEAVIGKRLVRDIAQDQFLKLDDLR
jgi:N,N'-diacetyllegionaminate synthase